MPIILTVGFCRGFPFFSVERIINEEKIIALKVATCAVAKRSWFKYVKFKYSFRKNLDTDTVIIIIITISFYHHHSHLLLSSLDSAFVSTKNQTQTQTTSDKLRSETSLSSRCGLKRELVKPLTFPAQHYRRFIKWTVHLKSLFGLYVPRKVALPRTLNGHG